MVGKYRTTLVDPPYPIKLMGKWNRRPNRAEKLPYKSLPLKDIAQLPVNDLAEIGCHLWLWTTNQTLETKVSQQESLLNILGDSFTKRILIDIDGCITIYNFTALVWKHFKVDITGLVISAYDLADLLGVSNLAIDIMFKDTVWGKPDFNKDALEILNDWKQKGYELAIHSSRVNYMGEIGLATWLVENKIPFSGIDITGKMTEYDVQIDDRPSKLANATSRNKLLFDSPWNKRCFDILGQFKRVYSWAEIRRLVSQEI